MKFGLTFTEYLQEHQEPFLVKSSHVEYKRLKKVLKGCRRCHDLQNGGERQEAEDEETKNTDSELCQFETCQSCDQKFFDELTKEASEIAGCFSSRVRRLLNMHFPGGLRRCLWRIRQCFMDDHLLMIQEGRMLLDYVTANAIAIRKILKKYDKIHGSIAGRNFKTAMRTKQIELLQSPWLIELGAFYINFSGSDIGEPGEFFRKFSCNLSDDQPAMIMTLSDSVKYEYNLTCPICLEILFIPYALRCGHLFCKACACSAASLMIFQGLKEASKETRCPVCRAEGVYAHPVEMMELDLLLKNRCKMYWKERLTTERAEMVEQLREYWKSQTVLALGY